jgi:5,10-methenyltetrahydrofolate synthetase
MSADADSHTRRALRRRLIAQRELLSDALRDPAVAQITAYLDRWIAQHAPGAQTIALYSAHRGEVDLAPWACSRTQQLALPVAQNPGQPLLFSSWQPGDALTKDHYGIWIPAHIVPVAPDLLLIPCVGFTPQRLRLGYGGGYYDRTLQSLARKPLAVGIAFSQQQCNFEAAPHDVALDAIVTEKGVI